jgi:uncharacterized protein (DUF1800 family)
MVTGISRDSAVAAIRFGLGARPGELAKIGARPQRWLLDQLQGPHRMPPELAALPGSADLVVEAGAVQRRQREAMQPDGPPAPDVVERYGAYVRRNYTQQIAARYGVAVASAEPFLERLVHFWSNHFAVSAEKPPMPALAGLYEKEAIRPHVAGKFVDLLLAAEKHPAMLLYLDNTRSIGPGSDLARRANRRKPSRNIGLNENLAREILELHTLGVNGGYTQDDVTTFARVITGWSVGTDKDNGPFAGGKPGTFFFRENLHEPGPQTLLGRTYKQPGVAQGEAVLRDIAVRPATARFVCTKLARHFIADDPPAEVVDRLSDAYLDSDGDLAAVSRAIIESPEAWSSAFGKYKSPHEFVLSACRAFGRVPENSQLLIAALDLLGQPAFKPGSPEGWPDTAEQWGGADALYRRIEWSAVVGRALGAQAHPVALGDAILGPALSARTRDAIGRAESLRQGTVLLLASPDFQRR